MQYVRMVMIDAGVIVGKGLNRVIEYDGLEPGPESLPAATFMSNDGWHVTAEQAAFTARRLRRAVAENIPCVLMSFFDDGPEGRDLEAWVVEFAEFNEKAAQEDGYHVR